MSSGIAPYLSLEELEVTIKAQNQHTHALRDTTILLLSHYMGLRSKELAGICVGDVYDARTGEVRSVVPLRATVTKGKKFRQGFLTHKRTRDTLAVYLRERGARHLDAPLFMSQRGGQFSANTMQRLLRICYDRANIKASSHSGRRSYANNLLRQGADIFSIQQLMGHASITTTQAYFVTSPERLMSMSSRLE